MDRSTFIHRSVLLGDRIRAWLDGTGQWPEMDHAVACSAEENIFFTPYMQRRALEAIAEGFLRGDILRRWTDRYPKPTGASEERTCGVVAAGNIPAVAFHDILSVMAAGWKPIVKLSSKDRRLLPVLFPDVQFCSSTEGWRVDALLTMGGDAASRYFKAHFPGIPGVIRAGRFSAAVIKGNEGSSALRGLAEDMLLYYGLGCRSVTCLLVPAGYSLAAVAEQAEAFASEHLGQTAVNNHRRSRAVLSLAEEDFIDSGTVIFRDIRKLIPGATEDMSLCCPWNMNLPVGQVWYAEYRSEDEIEKFITANKDRIQKIIRNFGSAQRPAPDDWPDGVDAVDTLLRI